MAWIVRSTVIQSNQTDPFVHRNFRVEGVGREEAVDAIRKSHGGYVSVVGFARGNANHHFRHPSNT